MRRTTDCRAKPLRRPDKCALGPANQENCGNQSMKAEVSAQPESLQDTVWTEGDDVFCGLTFGGFGTCTARHRPKAPVRSSLWRHRCLTRRVIS